MTTKIRVKLPHDFSWRSGHVVKRTPVASWDAQGCRFHVLSYHHEFLVAATDANGKTHFVETIERVAERYSGIHVPIEVLDAIIASRSDAADMHRLRIERFRAMDAAGLLPQTA